MSECNELLQLFIDNGRSCSIADFNGSSIAIDVSSWLHKALQSHIEEVMDIDFQDHMLYVDFLLYRTRNFRMAGVEPVMVFSGLGNVTPCGKESERVDNYESAIEQGKRLLECMRSTEDSTCRQKIRNEAIACFQRGLRVTPMVERNCIAALRRVGVLVVVAPYEVNAQLASLCRAGICKAVLTEDPKVILFGAMSEKPFPILYRFDSTGMVHSVSLGSIASGRSRRPVSISPHHSKRKKGSSKISTSLMSSSRGVSSSTLRASSVLPPIDLKPKSDDVGDDDGSNKYELFVNVCNLLQTAKGRRQFIQLCLLLGNDYVEPMFDGITLELAYKLVERFADCNAEKRFEAMTTYINSSEGYKHITMTSSIEEGALLPKSPRSHALYLERISRYEIMLFYQPIYDPKLKHIKNYSSPNYTPIDSEFEHTCPAVNSGDIFRLGHDSHILYGQPDKVSDISVESLCEGGHDVHDFGLIEPLLPWEKEHIAKYSNERYNCPSGEHASLRGVWHNRAVLVKSLAAYIPNPTILLSGCVESDENSFPSLLISRHCKSKSVRPPPASTHFRKELERFERECHRLREAYQKRFKKSSLYHSEPIKKAGPENSGMVQPCYKSPPTHKQTVNDSQENIIQNVMSTDNNDNSPAMTHPVRTPPAPLLSGATPSPLSPNAMRLAPAPSQTSLLERPENPTETTKSDLRRICSSITPSGKRKHIDNEEDDIATSAECKKNKHAKSSSIKSYFLVSPAVR